LAIKEKKCKIRYCYCCW